MSNINEETINEEASETQDAAVSAAEEEATSQEASADVEASPETSPTSEEAVTETVAESAPAAAAESAPAEEPVADAATAEETVAETAAPESPAAEASEAPTVAAESTEPAAAEPAATETVAAETSAPADSAEETVSADTVPVDTISADAVTASSDATEAGSADAPKGDAPAADGAKAEDGGEAPPDATMLMLEKAMADKVLIKGQVIGWNKGGYHVAVEKIAAFCPVSQIEIGNPRSPKRYLDKTFDFRVLEIQKGGRRVVLSRAEALKAEREARAKLVRERLKPNEELEGKVTSITTFGAFVDLGGGIEGLVHISELSRKRVEHPKELVQVGQEVKVTVLKIEKGGQRISLSMKRLEDDPWEGVADRFPPGEKFTGKILRKTDFGMFVELESGLEGLVHLSRLLLGTTLEDESFEVGNEIEVWVHEVDSKRRRLSLSMREVVGGNPWKGVGERFPEGEIVTGTVERLTNFGVFIELEPGLTGLLPFSAIPGIANPRRRFHAGKEVSVRVLSIDTGRKRISLGTETSKAEGSPQDYREYQKSQGKSKSGGMNALAAAFAKLKGQESQQDQQ